MADAEVLEEVLWHLHNWFETVPIEVRACDTSALPASVVDSLADGQWYRIDGSALNDGLHLHPATLEAETFDGTVTPLRIPKPLLRVVEDIGAWLERNSGAADSPYASESFGGYSYTLKAGVAPQSGAQGLSGWRLAFRDRLSPWRKI